MGGPFCKIASVGVSSVGPISSVASGITGDAVRIAAKSGRRECVLPNQQEKQVSNRPLRLAGIIQQVWLDQDHKARLTDAYFHGVLMDSPVKLIKTRRFGDDRGWFSETWSQARYEALGVTCPFVQDNQSRSTFCRHNPRDSFSAPPSCSGQAGPMFEGRGLGLCGRSPKGFAHLWPACRG